MPFDKAPAPFNTDYYVSNGDDAVRGAVVHGVRSIHSASVQQQMASKIPQSFDDNCVSRELPDDPMYVLPRTRFTVEGEASSAALGNLIVTALRSLCPADTALTTDHVRMKVSVVIPGTLDFKVKLFREDNGHHMVVVRRDSGDWFVFIQLYSAIKKWLRSSPGLTIECAQQF